MKPPARRTTIRSDLPSDLLEDFRLEAAEQLPRCELLLIELERAPKSAERLRELFRLIHTLKGNLGYVELNALMPLPQAIEDVLDALHCGAMTFDGRGRDGSYLPPPRTDPYVRNYRIRLLPRVRDAKRSSG